MDASDILRITPGVAIPLSELTFTASRSSGPGGQHVNKVSSRVTLLFDLDASPSLSPAAKERLRAVLGGRIGKDGVLQVSSQTSRSQTANKELAVERFVMLLRAALTPKPPRRKTRATLASKLRRLETKKRHGARKRERTKIEE
ncbi:Class I peptide chain release factor [Solidesulfovibrio fructosivorans JJ]]|uniref:Class I peptide chain release factor n=1 Tax=Solidesulfovibrio fructosivorans JJ] TaxID=596151 RepID=E1JZL1_SOLFR|nr:alternative ribosome rescue aminoacyl-tRNA hydrolase ArfB [Solidesulfovibrio fructosivorans]EFL50146.1 Class I peptide chain release factor [Solidesulfovibrio fructosivorans JJ]]